MQVSKITTMIIILCPIYFTEYDFENLGGSLNAKLPDSGLQPPSLPLLIHAQAVKVHSPDLDQSPIIVIKVIIEEQAIVFREYFGVTLIFTDITIFTNMDVFETL